MTLTLEPRDLLGVEESAGGPPALREGGLGAVPKDGRGGGGGVKSVDVELRRRQGEGFGFVIASQEVSGGEWQRVLRMSSFCRRHRLLYDMFKVKVQ